MEAFNWCGIEFDEGVTKGGEYGPYRQSDRKDMYREYADLLIQSGNAYYAFDTPEELNDIRKQLEAEKKIFTYDAVQRTHLKNSLTLSPSEVKNLLHADTPYVIRFKMPDRSGDRNGR